MCRRWRGYRAGGSKRNGNWGSGLDGMTSLPVEPDLEPGSRHEADRGGLAGMPATGRWAVQPPGAGGRRCGQSVAR